MSNVEIIWLVIGFSGQAMFSARFLVQWIMSEKLKKSVIPIHFWYFSIIGGIILFSYATYKRDIVFMTGQFLGLFVYARNLFFVLKEQNKHQ